MERLNKNTAAERREVREYPVKVLQFGEGNFLRGFVDAMIDIANEKGVFGGSVAIVKPIAAGSLAAFHEQDGVYTLSLRGKEYGETKVENRIITCVSDAMDVVTEYEKYAAYATCDTLRFVVSNTTEAGIVYEEGDMLTDAPPKTYPAKLTKLLYERFCYFHGAPDKGLIIIPCELIENNGGTLKHCVKQYGALWKLGADFETWVDESCIFCSTIVDRSVT